MRSGRSNFSFPTGAAAAAARTIRRTDARRCFIVFSEEDPNHNSDD
jgi:hypothetical protein